MSDQSGEHVHWAGDGRGPRLVFIDGVRTRWVAYSDIKAGIAVALVSVSASTLYGVTSPWFQWRAHDRQGSGVQA